LYPTGGPDPRITTTPLVVPSYYGNLRVLPPRNKALIRPYFGKRMVKSPLIKPAISWGKCGIGGVPLALGSHDASQVDSWTVSAKANTPEV